jgi:cell division protein FtsL
MNKHRNKDRRFSMAEMVLLCIAAPVLMGGGFVHAWLKNSQVEVVKEIRKAETRIIEHNSSINSLQAKIDKKLNIYQVRDDLERAGSELVEAPASSVKKISPYIPHKAHEMSRDFGIAGVQP